MWGSLGPTAITLSLVCVRTVKVLYLFWVFLEVVVLESPHYNLLRYSFAIFPLPLFPILLLPPAFYSVQEPHSVLNPLLALPLFILTTLSTYVACTCPLCLDCHYIKVGIILTTHSLLYTPPIPACTHWISEYAPLLSQCGPYHSTCAYMKNSALYSTLLKAHNSYVLYLQVLRWLTLFVVLPARLPLSWAGNSQTKAFTSVSL